MLYEISVKNKLPHKKTGKLIVAVKKEEDEDLERLYDNGKKTV